MNDQMIKLGLHVINAFDEAAPLLYDSPDFSLIQDCMTPEVDY